MLIQATERKRRLFKFFADKYKTREMCKRAVEGTPWTLQNVPDKYNT